MNVFVNGYGSIGSRISTFILDDPDLNLIGVSKYSPDDKILQADAKGIDVYIPEKKSEEFAAYKTAGTIEGAIRMSDLIIDCSPGGMGYRNKMELYEPLGKMAIYQGGETIYGKKAVSKILFNSRANYNDALGARHVMQGSCNVTGMGRILQPLREKFGDSIVRFDVTLVRRWADLEQTNKTVTDTIEMTESPHHRDDVMAYMGSMPLHLRAIKVPSRQMHLHILDVRFKGAAPDPSEFLDLYRDERGVAILWNAKGTKQVRDFADSMGFSFTDTNMIHIHANMVSTLGDTVQIFYSDDQTGIVIPENHMLMQAMLFGRPYEEAFARTESLFHMDEKKRRLESRFANH